MGLGSVGEAGMETSREGPRNRLLQRKNSGWVCFDERSRLWAYTRRDRMEVDYGQAGPGRSEGVTRVGEGHPKAPQSWNCRSRAGFSVPGDPENSDRALAHPSPKNPHVASHLVFYFGIYYAFLV